MAKGARKIASPVKCKPKKRRVKKLSGARNFRRKFMMYKCTGKSESVKNLNFQQQNEHGAFNNVVNPIPYYTLQFAHQAQMYSPMKVGDIPPKVAYATFVIELSDKDIYDKYETGKDYSDLPINV